MKNVMYSSNIQPSVASSEPQERPDASSPVSTKMLVSFAAAVALVVWVSFSGLSNTSSLDADSALTLSIFILAIWAWIFSPLADTYVSLAAMLVLVLTGVLSSDEMVQSLGTSSIWLLVAAFVMSQAITVSGLTQRFTAFLLTKAQSTRSLMHLLNMSLYATAFLVPSTSGRAALALPIFLALAGILGDRPQMVKAVSIMMPATLLLSAVSSYIGAGAHLITDEILVAAGYEPFGFLRWFTLGAGLGLVASIMCTELVYLLFVSREDRAARLNISYEDLEQTAQTPVRGAFTATEQKTMGIMALVIGLWATETLHGINAVTVALLGALLVSAPGLGNVKLAQGIKKAPWPLLMFMAATLALGKALETTGTATWLAESLFAPAQNLGERAGAGFIVVIVVISTVAHLTIQSRSARSAVLIPLIITAAVPLGVNPATAAFISTAAAGFCHTMTSSAKPVALFSDVKDIETYHPKDLLKLSTWLAPLHIGLIIFFSFVVWPAQGLDLYTP